MLIVDSNEDLKIEVNEVIPIGTVPFTVRSVGHGFYPFSMSGNTSQIYRYRLIQVDSDKVIKNEDEE